jgi:PII-like signaling protein
MAPDATGIRSVRGFFACSPFGEADDEDRPTERACAHLKPLQAGAARDDRRREGTAIKSGSEGLRLRVYIHERLRHQHRPLYAIIVELARHEGMAGATVFRGIEGYGLHRHLHTTRLLDVSDDLPVIVEIVDTAEAIQSFLQTLDALIPHGMATLSPVSIIKYSGGEPG